MSDYSKIHPDDVIPYCDMGHGAWMLIFVVVRSKKYSRWHSHRRWRGAHICTYCATRRSDASHIRGDYRLAHGRLALH